MKKSRFSESQIVNILKEAEAGVSVEDLSRQHGFSKASFYKWKAKYGGMSISEVKRMKELEEENRRLKQMYANLSLEHEVLKDIARRRCRPVDRAERPLPRDPGPAFAPARPAAGFRARAFHAAL